MRPPRDGQATLLNIMETALDREDPISQQQQLQQSQQVLLSLSEAQEHEVAKWTSDERNAGFLVSDELITWFAGRVLRRDGSESDPAHVSLPPGFAGRFLARHPDLAKRLVTFPPPVPEGLPPKAEEGSPLRGQDRMKALMDFDRTRALFGDSPPPARAPETYPEGEVIYQRNARYIVRNGDTITKYTTFRHGLGANDQPNEAIALRFIKENTTIPVPEVYDSAWDRVTMEYIPGQTLKQAWPVLTEEERTTILDELRGYIAQLRALSPPTEPGSEVKIGRLDGEGILLPSIFPRSGGPFSSVEELHHWLVRPPRRQDHQSMYWHQITQHLGSTDYPIVFTHCDLAARNIMVRDGHVVAILDWEYAGWCPAYWEYVFAITGMDNVDWATLGTNVPSLFTQRYDLEYILLSFIITVEKRQHAHQCGQQKPGEIWEPSEDI